MKKIKFREFTTRNNLLVLGGKDEISNEKLVKQVLEDEIVLHTEEKGSPFVVIRGKPKKQDIKEAALFCAIYSQDWKKNKGDVIVHIFYGKDVYKKRGMKTGTFGVKKYKVIIAKKKEILRFEKIMK